MTTAARHLAPMPRMSTDSETETFFWEDCLLCLFIGCCKVGKVPCIHIYRIL